MKIIYHCYGGTHSSVIAAALHLGLLKRNRLPSAGELLACPNFDQRTNRDYGKIFYMGNDKLGYEVYVMGCKNSGTVVETALREFCKIMDVNDRRVTLACTVSSLNILLKFGGFLSRRLNLVTIGRLFLFPGSRLAFYKIRKIVEAVEDKVRVSCKP
ncbi:MAG: DUF3189 family protein [Firmicutes bacterium]|nr:DUF3189 family protein [Bacillota bacterium]